MAERPPRPPRGLAQWPAADIAHAAARSPRRVNGMLRTSEQVVDRDRVAVVGQLGHLLEAGAARSMVAAIT